MKTKKLFPFLLVGFMIIAPALSEERVAGSSKINVNSEPGDIYSDVLGLPITQNEVNLFLNVIDPIERWGNTHKELWNGVNDEEKTILAISNLEVWKNINVTYKEYIALLLKLKAAQEIFLKELDAETLKSQVDLMEDMINDKNMPDESKEDLRKNLSSLNKMILAVESYPAENLTIFKENEEKIKNVLARFDKIGRKTITVIFKGFSNQDLEQIGNIIEKTYRRQAQTSINESGEYLVEVTSNKTIKSLRASLIKKLEGISGLVFTPPPPVNSGNILAFYAN